MRTTRTPLQASNKRTWFDMKARCHRETHKDYRWYGALGITVCERWRDSYEAFVEDMGMKPSTDYTIDRIDGTRGYEPGNCRWATRTEQCRNQKSNRFIEIDGERLCYAEWSRKMGFQPTIIAKRIHQGWDPERAVRTPVRPQSPRGTRRRAAEPNGPAPDGKATP